MITLKVSSLYVPHIGTVIYLYSTLKYWIEPLICSALAVFLRLILIPISSAVPRLILLT